MQNVREIITVTTKLKFDDLCTKFVGVDNYIHSLKMALPKHQLSKLQRAVFVFTGVAKRGNVPKEARLVDGLDHTQPLWPTLCNESHAKLIACGVVISA